MQQLQRGPVAAYDQSPGGLPAPAVTRTRDVRCVVQAKKTMDGAALPTGPRRTTSEGEGEGDKNSSSGERGPDVPNLPKHYRNTAAEGQQHTRTGRSLTKPREDTNERSTPRGTGRHGRPGTLTNDHPEPSSWPPTSSEKPWNTSGERLRIARAFSQ